MPEVPDVPEVPTDSTATIVTSLDSEAVPACAEPTKEEEDPGQKKKILTWSDLNGGHPPEPVSCSEPVAMLQSPATPWPISTCTP